MKISLCIPMYNESSIIAETAATLSAYMTQNFEDFEILFSDDGSTDGSADIVRSLALPNVRVVGYSDNRGKGSAVRHAILETVGDIVIFTDSDLAYGTEVIGRAVEVMEKDAAIDVLVGSRNISKDGYEGYTLTRKLASKAYIKVLGIVGGLRLSDSQCGFKAFRGEAARRIFSYCEVKGFAFDFEAIMIATRMKMKMSELAVKVINHRESKVHVLSDAFRMMKDLRKMKKRVKKLDL